MDGDKDPSQSNESGQLTSAKDAVGDEKLQKLIKMANAMLLSDAVAGKKTAPKEKRTKADYAFWSTQPVPDMDEATEDNGPIEPDKPVSEIRAEPYTLPNGFKWCNVDLDNEEELQELYQLLNENYVEDDDNMFRFDYSKEFLNWALRPPGWHPEWQVGVRVNKTDKLVGFIGAVPVQVSVHKKCKRMVEINFLCVHKRLRSKRMAPVLIREVTRRVHLRGLFQALYTSGTVLPKAVGTSRYWHRPLNPRKLVECGFSHLSRNMTMQRMTRLYKLPDQVELAGFREMKEADLPQARLLLDNYLKRFKLRPHYNDDEFRHFFLPRAGVVASFVVEGPDGKLTDFASYYILPSSITSHKQHSTLRAAYSFYTVANTSPVNVLMQSVLICANNTQMDVFNALNVMENPDFLEDLKFGVGDGSLHYYLYNWRCAEIEPKHIGAILQ